LLHSARTQWTDAAAHPTPYSANQVLKGSWLNIMIIAAPLGLAAEALGWTPTTTFVLVGLHHCRAAVCPEYCRSN